MYARSIVTPSTLTDWLTSWICVRCELCWPVWLAYQTSSRAAMPTTQSIHPPPGSRTRHPTTWQRRQDGAQDTFLQSRLGSFTPCRWHQRRFAMPGATVDPAGTSGSLARTKGVVRRKAIPQPAVSLPNADGKPAPTAQCAISEAGGSRAWGSVGQAGHVLAPLAFLAIAGVITDSGGDIIDVGFPQPRGVVVAGGGQGCACRGLKTTELTLLAQDQPACTSTVHSRAEVRTRSSREPRPRLLVHPVPFNPLD
jgi:hypothetical protein